MKKNKKDITIIGNAIVDVLASPVSGQVFLTGSLPVKNIELSFGGDALNEVVILSRFGKEVELISKLGRDEAGQRVLDFLKENKVKVDKIRLDKDVETSVNIVLIDERGERYFLTNPRGSQRRLEEADILSVLDEEADIVSFASIFVSPKLDLAAMQKVFQKIKSRQDRILVADITKAKCGEKLEDLSPLLPYIDYILPNEEEAALLTGERDPYINAKRFVEAGANCVIIKCGKKGCLLHSAKESIEIPAFRVKNCVDTTGAGDSFAAGFIWALSEDYSLEECGRFACAAASCAVEKVGATARIESIEEPLKRMKKLLQ